MSTPFRSASAQADQTGEAFTAAAGRLAGVAGALLGWLPAEFWAATPAELAGVIHALAGDGVTAAMPPDSVTIRRLMEAFPDG